MLGFDPANYPCGGMTCHLHRLGPHGLIARIPHSHRYQLTPAGLRIALFFFRTYARPHAAQTRPDHAEGAAAVLPLRAAFDRFATEARRTCGIIVRCEVLVFRQCRYPLQYPG
jgi:hypothetical protein